MATGGAEGSADLRALAARFAAEQRADVLLFRGPLARGADDGLALGERRSDRPNLILVLSTLGGSADAAFKVARVIRRRYDRLTAIVDDPCKGAGMLLVVAADELVLSQFGELGPLDVHGGAPVRLGEMASGLAPLQTLRSLRAEALDVFEETYRRLRQGGPPLSSRIAAERASEIAVGLTAPIAGQIEAAQVGEAERTVRTAREYARRVERGNLKPGALDRLLEEYPSHDFAIDLEEARTLFERVRPPSRLESDLLTLAEPIVADRRNEGRFLPLDEAAGVAPPAEPVARPVGDAADAQGAAGGDAADDPGAAGDG